VSRLCYQANHAEQSCHIASCISDAGNATAGTVMLDRPVGHGAQQPQPLRHQWTQHPSCTSSFTPVVRTVPCRLRLFNFENLLPRHGTQNSNATAGTVMLDRPVGPLYNYKDRRGRTEYQNFSAIVALQCPHPKIYAATHSLQQSRLLRDTQRCTLGHASHCVSTNIQCCWATSRQHDKPTTNRRTPRVL
jgi:hypothetical protein